MNARWHGWQRDLLFALAGAIVASTVLVPIGVSRLRAERQRAEIAGEEAAKQRAIVEEQTRVVRQGAEHKKSEDALDEEYKALELLWIREGRVPDESEHNLWEFDPKRIEARRELLEVLNREMLNRTAKAAFGSHFLSAGTSQILFYPLVVILRSFRLSR
jgi:hypothetical protein